MVSVRLTPPTRPSISGSFATVVLVRITASRTPVGNGTGRSCEAVPYKCATPGEGIQQGRRVPICMPRDLRVDLGKYLLISRRVC